MAFTPSAVLNQSTLNAYMKDAVEPIYTDSKLMEGLKAHGRIKLKSKATGKRFIWKPRVIRRRITALDVYNVQFSFPERNTKIEVSLDWIAYGLSEKLQKIDILCNQNSETQLVNLVQETIKGIGEDFATDFAEKLYLDGSGAGSKDIMGFESVFGNSGVVAKWVAAPNDTYAGKTTALQGLGGDWSGTWPEGTGDSEYAGWSPMVIDYNSANMSGTTHDWEHQWQESILIAQTFLGRNQRVKPEVCILNSSLRMAAKMSVQANDRFLVTGQAGQRDVAVGKLFYDGLEIIDEYAVPEDVGYLFRWKDVTLHSLQSELVAQDNDRAFKTSEQLYAADFYGQMQFWCPAFMAKLAAISSEGT
jgi:hypothetical protein